MNQVSCAHLSADKCALALEIYVAFFSLLVRKEADVFDGSLAFSPQFTHQVFGEKWVYKSPHMPASNDLIT